MNRCASIFYSVILCALAPWNVYAADSAAAVDPDITANVLTTPKGVELWHVEDQSLPIIAVQIAFVGAGSASDPAGKEGLANLAGELIYEGAGPYSAKQFTAALEESAIELQTTVDEDRLLITLRTLRDQQPQATRLLAAMLQKPLLEPRSLEEVRGRILGNLREQEANPQVTLDTRWRETLFSHSSTPGYAHRVDGNARSLAALSRRDVQQYLAQALVRKRARVAVVGAISQQEATHFVESLLDSLPQGQAPQTHFAALNSGAAPLRTEHVTRDIPQTLVRFGGTGPARADADYMPAYVMNYMVAGGGALNSILGQELRIKRGLTYSVDSSIDPFLNTSSWALDFSTRASQSGQALTAAKEAWERIHREGFNAARLEEAKQAMTGSYILRLDHNSAIAAHLISMQLYGLGPDYLRKRNKQVMAVTGAQAKDMFDRWYYQAPLTMVTVGATPVANAWTLSDEKTTP